MKNNLILKILKQSKNRFFNIKTLVVIVLILNISAFYHIYRELKILKETVRATVLEETIASPETENELNFIEELKVKDEELVNKMEELKVKDEELVNKMEELEKRDTEMTDRVQKLEGVSALLGKTLEICEVVPKAYHQWSPDPRLGLEGELNRCANSYYKLKNSF